MPGAFTLLPVSPESQIRRFYVTLYRTWRRQHWWPARTRFEVIVGAILTQNTAWTNVERALACLRKSGVLSLEGVRRAPESKLAELVRSSGYFRQKAHRLKNFIAFLDNTYQGSLRSMFARPTAQLRQELLALHGIGPETADSILLYAGNHPVFVVDAYTRRVAERHDLLPITAKYDDIRLVFERALIGITVQESAPQTLRREIPQGSCHSPSPMSLARREPLAQVYNEMHALIVGIGKNYCLKQDPRCDRCPLGRFLVR